MKSYLFFRLCLWGMSIHAVRRNQSHLAWDNSIPPILTIQSGEVVSFDCLDASNGAITSATDPATFSPPELSGFDQVNGPIFVQGAEPGDTLQVEVLDVATANWGWTAILPGFGLLHDEFVDPQIKHWELNKHGAGSDEYGYAWFDKTKGIKIPLKPFCGEMGVAPAEKGAYSTIPPYVTGGNIDTKHLTVGSTLYLPVKAPGALFSVGDGHAAQGDGEVCGTAIETPITVKVRLTVVKDKPYVGTPHYKLPHPSDEPGEFYGTTGVGPDIREAARDAVRNMITYLVSEYGLTRSEAYMLSSVAGDLRLHEVVDMPNYVVGFMIPRSIFGHAT